MTNTATARHDVLVAIEEHGWEDVKIAWQRSHLTRGSVVIRIGWSHNGEEITSATRRKDARAPVERASSTDSDKREKVLAWLTEKEYDSPVESDRTSAVE